VRGWYYTNPRDVVAREIGASRKALAAEGRWMVVRIMAYTLGVAEKFRHAASATWPSLMQISFRMRGRSRRA